MDNHNSMSSLPTFNDMQTVKRHFFAMRNGVIADVLRRNGSPFHIIFGLNLPQISDIAAQTPHNADLAQRLWNNSTTRESMMLAPMIFPKSEFSLALARSWVATVPAHEIADVLCLKLLKHSDFALELVNEFAGAENEMQRYTALRLMFNLVGKYPAQAADLAKKRLDVEADASLRSLATLLMSEAEFATQP